MIITLKKTTKYKAGVLIIEHRVIKTLQNHLNITRCNKTLSELDNL